MISTNPQLASSLYACILSFFLMASATSTFAAAASIPDNPVQAAEAAMEDDAAKKGVCAEKLELAEAPIFVSVATEVKAIRKEYCEKAIDVTQLQSRIGALLLNLNKILPGEKGAVISATVSSYIENNEGVPQFSVAGPIDGALRVSVEDSFTIPSGEVQDCEKRVDNIVGDDHAGNWGCLQALKHFTQLYDVAHQTFARPLALPVITYLEGLERKWDEFYEESRSQTILEMLVNGHYFQKNNKAYQFMEPPERQIILLHPSLVIENVPDAVDGEKTKEAILLELAGINWWRQDRWYLPSGGSFSAVYADYSGVEDWGLGVAFHFRNKFTLGIADHDGDASYFVSIDLLKLLQQKNTLLEQYRDKLDF